jgi:glycosyl hydrolase family 2
LYLIANKIYSVVSMVIGFKCGGKMIEKMDKLLILPSSIVGLFFFSIWVVIANAAVPVAIKSIDDRLQLLRNGEPFLIKGAGGKLHFDRLAEYGGNSIRTWSTENAQSILDEAEKLGLTVTLGLWVGHESGGFDYDNEMIVARQLERMRQDVLKYKDHPALLMWGAGNEVNLDYANVKVWDAIEDIAKMIAEIDGEHPIMTVLAGAPKTDIEWIIQKCPHIEVLGINSYAGLQNIPKQLNRAGWNKPFVITEWGPNGYWEVPATDWGVALEQNSSEKAEIYLKRYQSMLTDFSDKYLGSYVFLWGHKLEVTPTWFGLFLEDGQETAAVDVMQFLWNGFWPENRAPEISGLTILNPSKTEGGIRLNAKMDYQFSVSMFDSDGDKLNLTWEILSESDGENADYKAMAKGTSLLQNDDTIIQFNTPEQPGAYRLYCYVFDDHNHAATINVPFLVQ